MQSKKMPSRKSELVKVSKQRRNTLVGAGAVLLLGLAGWGAWQWWQGKPGTLDTNNGVKLLPQDTLLSVGISTNPEEWKKFREFGVPESRGIIEQKLAQLQTDFLTNYGYDYQRDIQPWIGRQVLISYLYAPGSKDPKTNRLKLPQDRTLIILPIANPSLAKQFVEQHQPPTDANLVESDYQGFSIQEIQRKTGTIATAIVDNFVAIGTSRQAVEKAIDTHRSGNSVLKIPGYTKSLSEIATSEPFAQVYVNIPLAMGMTAANSPQTMAVNNIAQSQNQQGIAANATLEGTGILWQGVSWLKPQVKQKLVVENNSKNIAKLLPSNTLLMVSGGNLQQLWQDFVASADRNPIAPFKPEDVKKNLESITSLDLESEVLNWSKGEFAAAIVPKADATDTEFGAGLVLMQQASDRAAAEKALERLDTTMNKKQGFSVGNVQLGGKDLINWSSPLGGVSASRGWLDNNIAFLSLGAPVTNTFFPQPQARLVDNPLFQQATRSRLNSHNGQFFIDVDRTINAGNLPVPKFSAEINTLIKAIRNIGVTSAVIDEATNRFDLFVSIKKEPGILLPAPTTSKSPSIKQKPQSTTP
jgi:hypothetical protein